MKNNKNINKTVYNFTSLTRMKFKSPAIKTEAQIKPPSVIHKIRSFKWPSSKKIQQQTYQAAQKSTVSESNSKSAIFPNSLQFIKKLTNQHFLVGNQLKVDAICLGSIVQDFIDTQYVWSLNFKTPISNIAVDSKKYFLAFLLTNQVEVYQYDVKKSKEPPTSVTSIKITGYVKFIQFARDSYLSLFYQNHMEIYFIDQSIKIAKKKYSKSYNQPKGSTIFQVLEAFQRVINIFFDQPKEGTSLFQLWNLQVRLQKDQILMSPLLKIYQIPNNLKAKIVLQNYSKQIFCMNLGHEILAVRKGYIIDTVNSNIAAESAVLRYLGNDRLIHITALKIQLYKFSINNFLNPPRIILESMDSIYSKMNDGDFLFLQVLEMFSGNIVVFYQISQTKNKSLSGQIKYAFCITQKVKFEDKVRQILPSFQELQGFKKNKERSISSKDYELIEEKCDMAMKMGLTRKQIHLRLWNNSSKSDLADYQFLLNTMDYETVRAQIQSKLKKKSMALGQVIKIEQGCLSMLQKSAFGQQTSQAALKDFLVSHFLLRKLKLYQLFHLIEKADTQMRKSRVISTQNVKEQSQRVLINIKDYIRFAKCDLKAVLLELIRELCFQNKDTVPKIRTMIRLFKFSFRPIYSQLLDDVIKEVGSQLLYLVQSIPQVLPYQHTFDQQPTQSTLYEGIWGKIINEEWQQNLFAGAISTIDTKDIVEELKNSVWAKRYFLSLHDLLPYSKKQILEIHQTNKSEQTFYNFIEKVFDNISDEAALQQLITFVQMKYQKLPQHLIGRIFLYRRLYQYLSRQMALKQKGQFNQFLKLKDFEICKLFFDLQKRKKNCILKDIKQGIYNSEQFESGNDIFNISLLNFFSSELSQISDIKYLLNRLNNEKIQFHSQNQGMYQVIVKGMQAKLYLGSQHDIPIDEVYIYISKIHIDEDSEIRRDLKYLDTINTYSAKFRQVKLNMSVFQIIRQVKKVLSIIIGFQVKQAGIVDRQNMGEIISKSREILDYADKLKNDIYFQATLDQNLVLFIFLTKILQSQRFIQKVSELIRSPEIGEKYNVSQIFVENVVLYMYKKRFSSDKVYRHNQIYIKELLGLLAEQNQTRMFISYETELGCTLSCDGNLLQYPLGGSNGVLSTVQLETAINCLPGHTIKNINFQRICLIALKMQQISSNGQISSITLYQIYEIVILRLLQSKLLRDSLTIMRKIIQINPLTPYNFIYPVLIIKKISSQLCDENRTILLTIMSCQYGHPEQLLDLIQKLLNSKSTTLQQKIVLNGQLRRIQGKRKTFGKNNGIFDADYVQAIVSQKQQQQFSSLLRNTLYKVTAKKDQFSRNPQYTIIFTILCNNPYATVKYLYCCRYQSNFKGIRCFFSYLIKQQVFNKAALLQLGKRIFKILHQGLSQTVYIESVIDGYRQKPLSDNMDIDKIKPDNNLAIVLGKCLQRFKSKFKQAFSQTKRIKQKPQSSQERKARVKLNLKHQTGQVEQLSNQYPFQDSDNQLGGKQTKLVKIVTNQTTDVQFDPVFEIQFILSREQKSLGMYLSQQYSTQEREQFYCRKSEQLQIKNSVLKLNNKKSQLQQGYSTKSCKHIALKSSLDGICDAQSPRIQVRPVFRSVISLQLTESTRGQVDMPPTKSQKQDTMKADQIKQPKSDYQTILQRVLQTSEGENYQVQPIKEIALDESQFRQFVSKLYNDDNVPIGTGLGIIKKLNQSQQLCPVNNEYLEIYLKMQSFQKKFNLDIDLKKMFPVQGIFLTTKTPNELFHFVKEKTIQLLTDNNVYKITKVMSLVFKNNDIEQQLNVSFLIKLLKLFEASRISDPKQSLMHKQKIKAFTQKISVHQLSLNDQDILNQVQDSQFRIILIQTIAETMRKKRNQQMAQNFLIKWHMEQNANK